MDHLAKTVLAATILMALAIFGLAIGLVLTGKVRLKKGCGLSPIKDPKKQDGPCPLCSGEEPCNRKRKEKGDDPRNDSSDR